MISGSKDLERGDTEGGEVQVTLPLAVAQIRISADSPVPIYEQICRALRVAIVAGDLPVGTLLPTSRELAEVLAVGRNTVVAAYSRLVAEGYLVSKFRRGTRVALPPQSAALVANAQEADRFDGTHAAEPSLEIGYTAQRALESPDHAESVALFGINAPDPALYPRATLGRLLADEFGRAHFGEADPQVEWRRFQDAVAAHFRQARGVNCEPGQIVPVSGMSAAADLAARLLLDPGHAVLVEDPSPDEIRTAFRSAGAHLYPMPCDQHGADPLSAKSPPPRLIYVSPSLSFPSGVQMSAERRLAIIDSARTCGAAIFESDSFAELLYTGSRLSAIQGLDKDNRVLYYGSLKNTLGPHIRVGFLVVPPNLADAFGRLARRAGCVPENFILAAVAGLIESNQYALHVKKIRSAYAQRLKLLVEMCHSLWPEVALSEPHGGFQLCVKLPDEVPAGSVAAAAVKQGLAVAPLSRFTMRKAAQNSIVVGFGAVPDRLIETAVRRLVSIAREERESAGRQVA